MSNPNSSVEFFQNHLNEIPTLLNELKQAMEDINAPIKSETLFLFMNVLYNICRKENLLDEYLKAVQNENNTQLLTEARNLIITFLSEEKDNFVQYMRELNNRRKSNYLNLTKMEYKFIGLCSSAGLIDSIYNAILDLLKKILSDENFGEIKKKIGERFVKPVNQNEIVNFTFTG